MNFQEFTNDIKEQLAAMLGEGTRLSVQTITKNNGVRYEGLIIMDSTHNISPTIYLDPYYSRYLGGASPEEISSDILRTYRRCMPDYNFDTSFFLDYTRVRFRIIPKAINYERNRELLKQVPHVRHLDLAVVFQCLLDSNPKEHATILIYQQHLEYWRRTVEELYHSAVSNAPLLLPGKLTPMSDILRAYIEEDETELSGDELPMYVLTNEKRINGAVCIFYPGLLKEIADRFQKDLVVLPSSIHETILIPADAAADLSRFEEIVREVNTTQVSDDEQLSDRAYLYTRDNDNLQLL